LVIGKATATVVLSGLSQTYDGGSRSVSATTTPGGLMVALTYNGSLIAPTAAGSYAVVGTITDANYTGSATGTMVIGKATAMVVLGGLSQTYDGSSHSVSATTMPGGLTVTLTYDGSPIVPAVAGSYTVVGTINDPNYTGSAAGTLEIGKATATVSLSGLVQTYNATARSASIATVPKGLAVVVTYDGLSTQPTNAGTYEVVATVSDPNYSGSASNTFLIDMATATIKLSGLSQKYDGKLKTVTVTTVPAGLSVNVTYDGTEAAPAAAGTYEVVATVVDFNYRGSVTNSLTIRSNGQRPVVQSGVKVFDEQLNVAPVPLAAPTPDRAGDAVQNEETLQVSDGMILSWPATAGTVVIEHSVNLVNWEEIGQFDGQDGSAVVRNEGGAHFFRAKLAGQEEQAMPALSIRSALAR
jgi:hypothetical protein